MVLSPRPINRLANAAPGTALAALGLATLVAGEGIARVAGVAVPLGILLALRGYRMTVETRADSVTVWGMLQTRTIPRSAITEVTDFPAIVWSDPAGSRHWSPVVAFQTPSRALPGVAEHHAECLRRLRKWARKR